jgi:Holliday junction resolvasome RuvABC endonuclease subunit
VLAIYLSTHGFAFVLFESLQAPFDWGVHGPPPSGADRNEWCQRRVAKIFEQSVPELLVLQDMSKGAFRRTDRIQQLNQAVIERAEAHGIPVFAYSREQVRVCFAQYGIATKDAIAEAIAKNVPALARYTPPKRKPWMSEDRRMALFDAAALALTFYHANGDDRLLPS